MTIYVEKESKNNRLTFKEEVINHKNKHKLGLFLCDCGTYKILRIYDVIKGTTKSCGCLRKELNRLSLLKHGDARTKFYKMWCTMIKRCYCESDQAYYRYGARGIKVCEEWHNYEVFKKWAMENGYKEGLTLDRKNNDLGYSPDNCRWVTMREQNRNHSNNLYITAWGETKLLVDWSKDERCNTTRSTITKRINRGITPEEAISSKDLRCKK